MYYAPFSAQRGVFLFCGREIKMNEILVIGSLFVIYGSCLLAYRLFGRAGLYVMTALATVFANIEVLMLIDGFGITQTLGNVMFAATYMITDILSENEGKKYASKAVWLGVFTSAAMLVFTQYWLLYTPSQTDRVSEHIRAIFSTTPRLLLASFLGYAVSQRFDVWLYHLIWDITAEKCGDRSRFLWLRNNAATMVSQIINTIMFNLIAFAGVYDRSTLIDIMVSGYVVYIFTSLADTPAVYFSRRIRSALDKNEKNSLL